MSTYEQTVTRLIRIASAGTVVIVGLWVSTGTVAAIVGHGDVEIAVSVLWSMIGPLDAIRNRMPSLGAVCGSIEPVKSTLRSEQGSAI